jgi:hypothetical protein
MGKTVAEILAEDRAVHGEGRGKRADGYYPLDLNSAEGQDYLETCRKIEKQQAAERAQRDQKIANQKYADDHYTPEPQIEFEDLPNNQNQVFGDPERWNWLFPAGCVVMVFLAMLYFGVL